ncbi:hypothetical protein Drorol1_Dr00018121 [Drosera rotundifolia]
MSSPIFSYRRGPSVEDSRALIADKRLRSVHLREFPSRYSTEIEGIREKKPGRVREPELGSVSRFLKESGAKSQGWIELTGDWTSWKVMT